jgi:hypothetical protein
MPEGLVVSISVLGEQQINRRMLRFAARAGSAEPALELIHEYLVELTDHQYETEGSQSGNPWAPLQQATIERKERSKDPRVKANADRIMVATGELRDSLTMPGNPNMVHVVTPNTMVFGTKVKRGQYHQKPAPTAHYPRRRSVDLTESNKLIMMKTIQLWIMRGVARLASGSRFRF